MLKPGGRFFLFDVVLSFDATDYASWLEQFVETMGSRMGPGDRAEAETHLREEYSTYSWIMEGLLERAGFRIDSVDYQQGFMATYLCKKK